jgi:hypothetical protein
MRGQDIVNRLKEVLSIYTDDFSEIVSITSLDRAGSTITCVTSSSHNLITGDYATIKGAKEPITISSITRADDVVTVTTATDHKLSDPSLYAPKQAEALTVEINGATPTEYNGTFKLLTAPDDTTFTYKIETTPASPATTTGLLLLPDFDGYNGYKQVTVLSSTSFTYATTNTSLGTPAQGTIQLSNASRIQCAATLERLNQFYSEDKSRALQKWLFVVMGSSVVYDGDSGTVASDLSVAMDKNKLFRYAEQQDLSLYIFLPSQNDLLACDTSDNARDLEKPILKSIANFSFPSPLTEEFYQPITYVGNEAEEYNTATYVHRYDFLAKLYIQEEDTADVSPGVPFRSVDGTIKDKNMTYKPNLR